MRVVAIISAFNEADIIGDVIRDLVTQGIHVYFMDDGSTDETAAIVEEFIGKGVIRIERREQDGNVSNRGQFEWARILRRKAELASEIDADWFIHHDADEFRESPWPGVSLLQGIAYVDRVGFNAIDFECMNFSDWGKSATVPDDGAQVARYTPPASYDRLQIRCWKRTEWAVDLESSGGHEACFPGRQVFPIRFLLRHYPLRGREHAARKIFVERQPRYVPAERQRGWHVQYDRLSPAEVLTGRDPVALAYDPDVIRLAVMTRHRDVEALEETLAVSSGELADLRGQLTTAAERNGVMAGELAKVEGALLTLREELARRAAALQGALDRADLLTADAAHWRERAEGYRSECELLQSRVAAGAVEIVELQEAVGELTQRVRDLLQSRSWRWTAGLRAAYRLVVGRP